MAVDFVQAIGALDFTTIDTRLADARSALEQGRQLSLGDLNPTAVLGELGTAITAVTKGDISPDAVTTLAHQALAALTDLIDLPDLSGLARVGDDLEQIADRLGTIVHVLAGGGEGTAVLERIVAALSGSLDVGTLFGEISEQAFRVLKPAIPPEFAAALEGLSALSGETTPEQLVTALATVVVGLDLADISHLTRAGAEVISTVRAAGDSGPLEAAVAAIQVQLTAANQLLMFTPVDVGGLSHLITEIGVAVDALGAAVPRFADGLATDLRTAVNLVGGLDVVARLDAVIGALPLPAEDIPRQLVESLDGMVQHFEQITEAALKEAIASAKDELFELAGLDRLSDLLSALDEIFADVARELDLPVLRTLRDDAVAHLSSAAQEVLAFDGLNVLDEVFAPVRELESTIRGLDLSSITDAVHAVSDQVNGLLTGVDLGPLRDALNAVIGPLGDIVDELVPFVQQIAEQLNQLVDELNGIDFHVAGTATLDLLHGIREKVTDAVHGGDVPDPVKAVVAGAAAALRQLDLGASLTAPFDSAVVAIDVDALVRPIENTWTVAGDALRKATPSALIAELDPPFEQVVAALDNLSLQPLIDAVQKLFDELVVGLQALDPRRLLAPLEDEFQELVRTVTATLDPAPLFAPLNAAYAALQDLLHQIDVRAMLTGVLGGIADMPGSLSQTVGQRLQQDAGAGAHLPASTDAFKLGDILRPLALFLGEIRARLAGMGGGVTGPALAELATVTRSLRALVDPATGFAIKLGDALDTRLAWLDAESGDGPLAQLRRDLQSFQLAVESAELSADVVASVQGIQVSARLHVDVSSEVDTQHGALKAKAHSGELSRSLRRLSSALDAALPDVLLTGTLDPTTATDAFLAAVFEKFDPTPLADQLDAIGDRLEARFLALADTFASGLFTLVDSLFASVEPLLPEKIITRLQDGVDRILGAVTVLDPTPIENEVRDLIGAAISLLAVHSPAAAAEELGAVFDACTARVRELSPAALFAGLDPFAPVKAQLETMKPSTLLAPLVDSTAGFTAALETIASLDLDVVGNLVVEIKQTFQEVLDGVEQEWNALLDELAQISGSASVSVG